MIGVELVRRDIKPHPWQLHRWREVNAMVGLFSLVRQCERCWMVDVHDVLADKRWRGPASMLKEELS